MKTFEEWRGQLDEMEYQPPPKAVERAPEVRTAQQPETRKAPGLGHKSQKTSAKSDHRGGHSSGQKTASKSDHRGGHSAGEKNPDDRDPLADARKSSGEHLSVKSSDKTIEMTSKSEEEKRKKNKSLPAKTRIVLGGAAGGLRRASRGKQASSYTGKKPVSRGSEYSKAAPTKTSKFTF